jgi:sn-glycerol 3-phosphate transport system substrate-binding protein
VKNYNKRRLIALSLVTLIFSLMLAACGASATNTAVPATTAPAAVATTAPAATTAAAASATTAPAATTAAAASATTAAAPAGTPVPAPTITPVPLAAAKPNTTKITFWYGLTGNLGNVVRQTVNLYNQSQDKYYVEPIQQPNYDDTINKLSASLSGGNLPNVVQIYDIGTQRMIDSKRIIPVQDLIDRDKLDLVNDLEPAVRNYYTIGGKLYSMPFNSSAPVMYFDKKAFREAGLDPEKKIWTYDEVNDAAKKLTKKDAGGKITRAGVGFTAYSWIFEQELATQTALFAEPNNGREQRATKLSFNNPSGENWLNFLKKLQDDGVSTYFGRDGGANSTARDSAYVQGTTAITFNSIAGLRGYISSAEQAGNKIEIGVAYIPRPTGAKGGVIIGGASLWITDQGSKEQQEAAWDFMKWTARPEVQAFWSSNTGYYPIRKATYEVADMKAALAKYPQFQVAVDQLRATEASPATSGAVFGTFTSARQEIEGAMDSFFTGKISTAKAALDDAAKKANEKLEEYNATVK